MLYTGLLDIMNGLKSKNIYIKFNTNGLLLTKEMNRKLIEKGLKEISISMDASTQETYVRIRRNNGFNRII